MPVRFLIRLLLGAGALLCSVAGGASPEPPRAILLLAADDLGYNDTTAYGGEGVHCPNVHQ